LDAATPLDVAPPPDSAPEDGPGWAGTPGHHQDEPGDAPATDTLADGPAAAEPGPPGKPADTGQEAWAPAPTLGTADWARPADEDPAADWERLAAGVQARWARAPAERWSAQNDADVANEWPGPPLPAARRAAISHAPPAKDGPAEAPPAPAAGEDTAPDARTEDGPPGDKTGNGRAPGGPREPGHAKRRKASAARPPLDLGGPPDPADEWISLLTADPADE
jgi:hypothetical protein